MTDDSDAGRHRYGDGGARRRADLEIGGYDDPTPIGRGGFAVVYRAWQSSFHRDVAIKVIDTTLDSMAVDRFERECLAIGALSGHPNIVMVHELGLTTDGRPFIVMEYLSGGTLADRIRGSPMPVAEATAVGVALAGALASAHAAGVLHRDVKPENVLVSRFGETKLADFGIARIQGRTETRTGSITASLGHAAPEVLAGQRPSVASDLYSVGSTLFTLLSGAPAFVRDTDESFLPMVTRAASEPVPDLRPAGIPDAVCRVIEQAMAKDPTERPSSAAELGRLLQAAQAEAGLPVTPLVLEAGDSRPQAAGFTVSIPGTRHENAAGPAPSGPRPLVGDAEPSGPAAVGGPSSMSPTTPVLEISDHLVDLGDVDPDDRPPAEKIYVLNRGGGALDWTVRTEADWVDVERQEGFFTMTFRPRPGTNQATVVVYDRNSGGAKTVRIRARVPAAGPGHAEPAPGRGRADVTDSEPASGSPPESQGPRPTQEAVRAPSPAQEAARAPSFLRRLTGRSRALALAGAAVVVALVVLAIVIATRPSGAPDQSTPVSGPGPATLYNPGDVVVGSGGAVYVGDAGHDRVRRIGPDGLVTTVAGRGGDDPPAQAGAGAPATSSSISGVSTLAVDTSGNLYLGVSAGGIAKVTPDGAVSQVPIRVPGGASPNVSAIAVGPDGGLLMAVENDVFKVNGDGSVALVAGSGVAGYSGDGGQATDARLSRPKDLVVDDGGTIYIADTENNRVRAVRPDGTIVTVAGVGEGGPAGDGGPAVKATVSSPRGVAVDDAGNLYVATSNQVRRVGTDGVITTVAGGPEDQSGFSGDDGPATAALLNGVAAVAWDTGGNLFVTDNGNNRVRRISPEGVITTVG